MSSTKNQKVLIMGAGVAGLVLAQVLRAHDIDFEIFERDPSFTARSQGWSVSLAEALPHLNELLPADLGDLSTLAAGYGAGTLDDVALYDAKTESVINRYGGGERGSEQWVMRPWRARMREFLWPHINVQTGKAFSHYTEDISSGSITAHFQDGSSASGTLLVGADGARSHVRKQMLGDDGPKLAPAAFQAVLLDIKLTKAQYEDFCKISTSTIVCQGTGAWATAAVKETFADKSAEAFISVAWKTDDAPAEAAWLNAASKVSKYNKAREELKKGGFPAWMWEYFDQAKADGVVDAPIILTEFVPPHALPRGSATLLGDALHAMTPFRGAGANTAIRDAADLARLLIKHKSDGTGVDTILREYEAIAVPRGRQQVLDSRAAAFTAMGGGEWNELLMKGRTSTKDGVVLEASQEVSATA